MLLMTLAPLGRGPFAQRPGAPTTATSAVMSPDAALVAGQTGWDLHIWERQSGKRLATINNHPSLFRGAIAAGVLAGISDEKPVVWRGERYRNKITLRKLPKVTTFGRVFLSPDGKLVGTLYPKTGDARDPDSFGVWDAGTGEPCGAVSCDRGRVTGLAFGPGGQVAAFGDEPGKRALLRLYQVGGQAGLKELLSWAGTGETAAAFSAAISPDGKRLAFGAGERILLWDLGRTAAGQRRDQRGAPSVPAPTPGPFGEDSRSSPAPLQRRRKAAGRPAWLRGDRHRRLGAHSRGARADEAGGLGEAAAAGPGRQLPPDRLGSGRQALAHHGGLRARRLRSPGPRRSFHPGAKPRALTGGEASWGRGAGAGLCCALRPAARHLIEPHVRRRTCLAQRTPCPWRWMHRRRRSLPDQSLAALARKSALG